MEKTIYNIRGAYGEANFGDDLLMIVFENYFLKEFPNAILNFEGEKAKYPEQLLAKATYNKKISADWLIYGGGTQFFAFEEDRERSVLEKIKIGLNNPKLILNKLKYKNRSTASKIAFLGFGLGPFSNNIKAIQFAKQQLSRADFIGVRDSISFNYCKEWGIKGYIGSDVVFSSYFDTINLDKSDEIEDRPKIGIIVRDWAYEESGASYIDKLKAFYANNKDKYDITFVIFSILKDKAWVKEIAGNKVLLWDPNRYSIEEFLSRLNAFNLIISARYHGAIIGALLKKPVICVEIEPKLRILTEQVKELELWEKPFNLDDLDILINQINYKIDYDGSLQELRFMADNMLLKFKEYTNV